MDLRRKGVTIVEVGIGEFCGAKIRQHRIDMFSSVVASSKPEITLVLPNGEKRYAILNSFITIRKSYPEGKRLHHEAHVLFRDEVKAELELFYGDKKLVVLSEYVTLKNRVTDISIRLELRDKEPVEIQSQPSWKQLATPPALKPSPLHELPLPEAGVLADWAIKRLCQGDKPMIDPFVSHQVKKEEYEHAPGDIRERKLLSYGLSSAGYDIRITDRDLKVFSNVRSVIVDPRKVDPRVYVEPIIHEDESDRARYIVLPGLTGMLCHTPEYFRIPRDVVVFCQAKSTYARVFVSVIVTPLEPEWEGQLVVEIVNHTPIPAKIYLDQGIAQLVFQKIPGGVEVSYADRGGKYQGQTGTTDSRV